MSVNKKAWACRLRDCLAAASLCAALPGCGQGTADAPSRSEAKGPGTTVQLTTGQLASIRIGTAQNHSFPVRVEAVGSVSFTDDPNVIQAESTLLGAAATYDLTRKELARIQALGTPNGIAEKDVEQAMSDEETAEAAYKAARDAVRALGKSEAEINRMVAAGKVESPGIAYRAIKWVVADVMEQDSPLVRVGQPVGVRVAALPGSTFQGSVAEIYSTVDPISHRVTVRAQVPDANNILRPGMLADVTILVQQPVQAIGVPETAVVREGDGTMTAWVTKDRRHFDQRIVRTGMREDGEVQILAGLQKGETVVTAGAIFLDNILNAAPSD